MLASPRPPPLADVHACVSDCAVLSGMSCRDEGVLISDRRSRSECQCSAPSSLSLSLPFSMIVCCSHCSLFECHCMRHSGAACSSVISERVP